MESKLIAILLGYILLFTSCSLNTSTTDNNNSISEPDPFALDSNTTTIKYPNVNQDEFLLIPTIRVKYGVKSSFDLSDYIISNNLNIKYSDNKKVSLDIENDSVYLSLKNNTNDIIVVPISVNNQNLDILAYASTADSQIISDDLIIKDTYKEVNNELILTYYFISNNSESNLADNTTIILLGNKILDKKYYHIFKDRIRIILPKYALNTTLRICSLDKDGSPLRENFTIISNGIPLLAEVEPSSIYFSNIYYLILDRFNDGDESNNSIYNQPIEKKLSFNGGDLIGLNKKISSGYFSRLGIKNILISPLYENPDSVFRMATAPFRKYMPFDGYHPINSNLIDSRFGSSNDFKNVVHNAKSKQIGILGSIIIGYTHIAHPYYQDNSWYLDDFYKDHNDLPLLDLKNIDVIKKISDDALFWINEFDLNGFLSISSNQSSKELYKYLNRLIRLNRGSNKLSIIQYPSTMNTNKVMLNKFDSSFNLDLYYNARSHFSGLNTNFINLNKAIKQNLYINNSINKLLTITGLNQYSRIISVADGDYSFESNSEKDIFIDSPSDAINPASYEKLFMFHLMNNSLSGIPLTYFGDEYGQAGLGNVDSMRKIKFQEELSILQSNLKSKYSILNFLRAKYTSLSLGDFVVLRESDNFTVWMKSYYNEKIIVVMNLQDKEININIPLPFKTYKMESLLSKQVIKLNDYNMAKIVVPPYKSDIFLLETKLEN